MDLVVNKIIIENSNKHNMKKVLLSTSLTCSTQCREILLHPVQGDPAPPSVGRC